MLFVMAPIFHHIFSFCGDVLKCSGVISASVLIAGIAILCLICKRYCKGHDELSFDNIGLDEVRHQRNSEFDFTFMKRIISMKVIENAEVKQDPLN